MKKPIKYLSVAGIIFCAFFAVSCGNNDNHQAKKEVTYNQLKKPIMKVNQRFTEIEDRQINQFVKRHGWKMTEMGSGLRYMIYHHGNGAKAEKGLKATVDYKISLLNGTILYSSDKNGPETFLVGKDPNIEYGVQLGVQEMHVGDEAKLILPSNLAFGVHGDDNKIPPRTTLVYDIALLKLSK